MGDDLFVTSHRTSAAGIGKNTANSILIKVNQINAVDLGAIEMAHRAGYTTVISHRASAETEDTTIADLAVAVNAGRQDRLARSWRACIKYNRLLRIERALGAAAIYG